MSNSDFSDTPKEPQSGLFTDQQRRYEVLNLQIRMMDLEVGSDAKEQRPKGTRTQDEIITSLWDLKDHGLGRFKVMLNLYRDTGREFEGEIHLPMIQRTLVYKLTNDKKPVAYLTQKDY